MQFAQKLSLGPKFALFIARDPLYIQGYKVVANFTVGCLSSVRTKFGRFFIFKTLNLKRNKNCCVLELPGLETGMQKSGN
jgi:hypothetical protein